MSTIDITTEDGVRQTIKLPIPLGWKVLVRPKQAPKQSKGGIIFDSKTTEAEQSMVYVGQILAMGDAAFTAKTQGGVSLSHIRRPQVGSWVIFAPFAGQKMRVKGDDSLLILMNDTELQGVIENPDDYYAWIEG
jgi:co-chaperonin GroES (HSP10)